MELSEKIGQLSTDRQSEPQINFLQIEHSDKNAGKVWEEARKNDVILMEVVDMSQARRTNEERIVNSISSIDSPTTRRRVLGGLYNQSDFISQTIRKIILEGKEFHYIDILDDNEAHKFKDDSDKHRQQAVGDFITGNFDTSLMAFNLALIAKWQSHNIRENLVSEQIAELKAKYANEWKGKQIGVIQGVSHSNTYRIFKKDNPSIKTSRSFLKPDRFVFPLEAESKRRLLHGSVEDRELTMKRSFLFELVIFPYIYSTGLDVDTSFDNAHKTARSLSKIEIESIFTQLSDIQKFAKNLTYTAKLLYVDKHTEILAQQIIESHPQVKPSSS